VQCNPSLSLTACIFAYCLDISNHGRLFLLPFDGATALAASSMTFERRSYGQSISGSHFVLMDPSSSSMRPLSSSLNLVTDSLSSLIASQSTGTFLLLSFLVWSRCGSA
jgi:hypothetical protein